MMRKNPETVVVSGFSEPISFSVRNVGLTLQKRYRLKTRLFTDFFEKMNIIFTSSDLCSDGFLGFILAYKKDIISFPCYGI